MTLSRRLLVRRVAAAFAPAGTAAFAQGNGGFETPVVQAPPGYPDWPPAHNAVGIYDMRIQ
ncbi:hypothetical protein [Tahibacter caeni]|uniref:hypothetical protein n=1 Tax=Tahibacter caeni TaxID=1453545 RepID=UPI002148F5D9|nr:hypothetical protein [Tahibacter caeni]